jgi:hypothetical protein
MLLFYEVQDYEAEEEGGSAEKGVMGDHDRYDLDFVG